MLRADTKISKSESFPTSDSVKRHLPNTVGVDLTSVMAQQEAGASRNAHGRGEIVGKLEGAFDFSEGKE